MNTDTELRLLPCPGLTLAGRPAAAAGSSAGRFLAPPAAAAAGAAGGAVSESDSSVSCRPSRCTTRWLVCTAAGPRSVSLICFFLPAS